MKILTGKDVIQLVLDRTIKDTRLQLYQSRSEKWCLCVAAAAMSVSLLAGLTSIWHESDIIPYIGVYSLYCSIAILMLYQGLKLAHEVRRMRNPEKNMGIPLADAFNYRLELIHELSQFQQHHLSYARATFEQNAKQLRERIFLLVGALDKVGLIPLAATAYLSYLNASRNGIEFGIFEWVGLSFIVLYLFAVRMLGTAQWMEYVADLYAHALDMRKGRMLSTD